MESLILALCAWTSVCVPLKTDYPPVQNLHIYRSVKNLTVAEFTTSRGDFCVAVAGSGAACEWKKENIHDHK